MSRRRWLYTSGGLPLPAPVEVTDPNWRNVTPSTGDLGKFEYSNLRATDGTPIDSRTKRREYMRAAGVTDASDFKETWAKARADREAYYAGKTVRPSMREAVGRAEYELSKRRRRG